MKYSLLTGALILAGYATAVPTLLSQTEGHASPLYTAVGAETLTDSYIVVLKNDIHPTRLEEHTSWVGRLSNKQNPFTYWLNPSTSSYGVRHVYDMSGMKGYSGKFDSDTLNAIRASNDVAYVEKDSVVYTNELQRSAPWGLARISHRETLSFGTFSKYNYKENGGSGIKVYVIDTGIYIEHNDFEGRAHWGKTIPEGDEDEDGNGHGTHCAGTIAGRKYGVAKRAEPVAVKVLRSNGSGSMSDVLLGVDWAVNAHNQDKKTKGEAYKGAVANMSLGGGKSRSLERAVDGAVEEGIIFAVAAGNDNRDACDYSPAGSEGAITVAASTLADERAYFSNHGTCVDVFAPGLNILSTYIGGKNAISTLSGTSMASPHVAGLAAYFLSLDTTPNVTPKQIKEKIIQLGSRDFLSDLPEGTPNVLVYNDAEP